MISLKRNSKGVLVEAPGIRTTTRSIYKPKQTEPFRISRSKFTDFLTCKRCFYLDRVKGLVSPSTPGWSLNETTDLLLKKEFDLCRNREIPHKIFSKYGLTGIVPFKHENIDLWRDALHHGLEYQIKDTNITLHGGVDDIWVDTAKAELIVVEYKSQASIRQVKTENYLFGVYRRDYKIQLDFYAYLLTNMGFNVSPVGYFYVCNADRNATDFSGQLKFEETLVPYEWESDWIDLAVFKMIEVLNSHKLPDTNPSCENCAYARQRTSVESRNQSL